MSVDRIYCLRHDINCLHCGIVCKQREAELVKENEELRALCGELVVTLKKVDICDCVYPKGHHERSCKQKSIDEALDEALEKAKEIGQ